MAHAEHRIFGLNDAETPDGLEEKSVDEVVDFQATLHNGAPVISAIASDMDHTMFNRDLGVLVFLEKLSDPTFWDFSVEDFQEMLLPKRYRIQMDLGERNKVFGLKPEFCRLVLDLTHDICILYREQQRLLRGGKDVPKKSEITKEFARKMIEFDRLFLIMDGKLSEIFSGELLMRVRFFAGKDPASVRRLTNRMMSRTHSAIDAVVDIPLCGRELRMDMKVDEDRISDVHGGLSPHRKIDRVVGVVRPVERLLSALSNGKGYPTAVVSANLQSIVSTAVQASPDYRFLHEQSFLGDMDPKRRTSEYVYGTKLKVDKRFFQGRDGGRGVAIRFKPGFEGVPVFADEKNRLSHAFAARRNAVFSLALGDSPNTDGKMLRAALGYDYGMVVVVGDDLERTRARFAPVFDEVLQARGDARRRIFYVTQTA